MTTEFYCIELHVQVLSNITCKIHETEQTYRSKVSVVYVYATYKEFEKKTQRQSLQFSFILLNRNHQQQRWDRSRPNKHTRRLHLPVERTISYDIKRLRFRVFPPQ